MNSAMIKRLTGGDQITASFKNKDQFTFTPKFTTVVASNEPPIISPDDAAAWGRIRLIEFPNSHFGKENANLKEQFGSRVWRERILAWMVEGARQWFSECKDQGRTMADVNSDKKESIRLEQDPIGQWLDERCFKDRALKVVQKQLFRDWQHWAEMFGYCQVTQKKFGIILSQKGLMKERFRDGYYVFGIDTKYSVYNLGYDGEHDGDREASFAGREMAGATNSQDSLF
jgi:putative DNA primase/helicase